jgi:peptidoglycan hydrolase CwlO-like protein
MFLKRFTFALIVSVLVFTAGGALVILPQITHADAASDAAAAHRAELEKQLAAYEQQIADTQKTIDGLHGQGESLKGTIATLNAQIAKAQLQIKATQTEVSKLDGNIAVHTKTIGALSDKLTREQASLADILRKTQLLDDYSLVEFAFSSEDVGGFFGDLDAYATIQNALGQSFTTVKTTRSLTEKEKNALEDQRINQQKLAQIQQLEKQQVVAQQTQKQTILTQTKGQEAAYQQIKAAQEKTAAQIRAELFALAGGSGEISLPVAIALAKQAGAATGVRPALILGILKQETNLGKNVGQCLLTNDPTKGDGKGKNTGTFFAGVMKPTRDVDPFMAITGALGVNPFTQPVSCPPSYGYGGAMGPGQFIPSTWVLYQDRVAKLAGHPGSPANPWNNLDAFTATAMLMADNGATAQTPAAERMAALRYFAGWGNASNPAYSFYGDGVMGFTNQFTSDIDTLSGG